MSLFDCVHNSCEILSFAVQRYKLPLLSLSLSLSLSFSLSLSLSLSRARARSRSPLSPSRRRRCYLCLFYVFQVFATHRAGMNVDYEE